MHFLECLKRIRARRMTHFKDLMNLTECRKYSAKKSVSCLENPSLATTGILFFPLLF